MNDCNKSEQNITCKQIKPSEIIEKLKLTHVRVVFSIVGFPSGIPGENANALI